MLDIVSIDHWKKEMKPLWMITGLRLFGLVLLCATGFYLATKCQGFQKKVPSPETMVWIRAIFVPWAFIELAFAAWLRKRMMSGNPWPRPKRAKAPATQAQENSPTDRHPAIGQYTCTTSICFAQCEMVCTLGFILILVGDPFTAAIPYFSMAFLGMIYFRPRLEDLEILALLNKTERIPPARRAAPRGGSNEGGV